MATNKLTWAFALLIVAGFTAFVHAGEASGASRSSEDELDELSEARELNEEMLFKAIKTGEFTIVRDALNICRLDRNFNIDAKDKDGLTALMWAAFNGYDHIVALLLKAGATIDAKGKDGCTALMWAAISGHADIVGLLLAAGADVDVVDCYGKTVLMLAGARRNIDVLRRLLHKDGINVNAVSSDGMTALDHVRYGFMEACLKEYGAYTAGELKRYNDSSRG